MGKFEHDMTLAIQTNDSIGNSLKKMDTNNLLKWRSQSKMLLLNFNINLGNDSLPIETAREIDLFVQSYRATDFFTAEISYLRKAQQDQQKRLKLLRSDISNGAGDRSLYYSNVQDELAEANEMRKHCLILEKQYYSLEENLTQFKPLLERYNKE